MKIVNIEGANLHIFWTTWGVSMTFSGKIWLMVILKKVTKNQASLSLSLLSLSVSLFSLSVSLCLCLSLSVCPSVCLSLSLSLSLEDTFWEKPQGGSPSLLRVNLNTLRNRECLSPPIVADSPSQNQFDSHRKKHPQIKLQHLQKVWHMGSWYIKSTFHKRFMNWNNIIKKRKVVTGKTLLFMIGSFFALHSDCLNAIY